MKKLAAFIFDMDGVIIDSEPIHSRVKMDTFAHFGLEFNERDLVKYMGRTSGAIFGDVLSKSGRTDLALKDIVAYKHSHYLEVLRSGSIQPVAGTVELIRALNKKNIPVALASSSAKKVIDTVIDSFKLEDAFKSVISGWELPKSKPDPAIYLLTAARLGVDANDCVVLEDTENGLLAAKGAGMYAIGYKNKNSGAQDLSLADMVVDNISDIKIDKLLS